MTAALAIVAVPVIVLRTGPRGDLFSTVLFVAFVGILWRQFQGERARLWLLPLLMLAWVNLHQGFVTGLAMMGAYVMLELDCGCDVGESLGTANLSCDCPDDARRARAR